jgi:hypothetical protein
MPVEENKIYEDNFESESDFLDEDSGEYSEEDICDLMQSMNIDEEK